MKILEAFEVIETLGVPYLQELSTFGALSEDMILDLLQHGRIAHLEKGEYIAHFGEEAADFQVVLKGTLAYYKRFEGHDVLTRHFRQGELLNISSSQFYKLHVDHPAEFGIFMLNLARELAREIELLEDVIGKGTGWQVENTG
jgi:hypothetical protein